MPLPTPTKDKLLRIIEEAGEEGITARELAEAAGFPYSDNPLTLRRLRDSGLVFTSQEQRPDKNGYVRWQLTWFAVEKEESA